MDRQAFGLMRLVGLLRAAVAFLGIALAAGLASGQDNYSLTVHAGGRQSFLGLGESQATGGWTRVPQSARNQMTDLVYRDLKVKVFRLWIGSGARATVDSMTNQFYSKWIASGAISEIASRGVDTLLLGPGSGEAAPKEPMSEYAAKIAEAILRIKNAWNVEINVTGLANEPQGWTTNQIADGVKYLRAELNKRGLQSVGIIASESANNDWDFNAKVDAMHADSNSWCGLTGIASHSYNNAVTSAQESRKRTKQFWMTEASDNGHEDLEDENRACTLAARFLNDMNHQVNCWVHFIGFLPEDDVTTARDTATKMISYDLATSSIRIWLKYHYFKQLTSTFDVGCVFRRVSSATESDMAYTYGQKPAINAAVALNPDGSWAIGIVNDTGVPPETEHGSTISTWHPATQCNVSLAVQELTNSATTAFQVYRSRANQHLVDSGTLTMTNGSLTINNIAKKELVCLRTRPSARKQLTSTP